MIFFLILFGLLFFYAGKHLLLIFNESENIKKYKEQMIKILQKEGKRVIYFKFLKNEESNPLYYKGSSLVGGVFGPATKIFYVLIVCEGENNQYIKLWGKITQSLFSKETFEFESSNIIDESEFDSLRKRRDL